MGFSFGRHLNFLVGTGVCVSGTPICSSLHGVMAVHQVPLGFLMKLIWKFRSKLVHIPLR